MLKQIVFWGLFLLYANSSLAQEFNTNVTINTPKLQVADEKIFKSLKTAIQDFMNSRKWTEQDFEAEEKIDLDLIINLTKELSETKFEAQLTILASRPVYNSGYNTVTFRHLDKHFYFDYGEFEVLDFAENSFSSNLTSTLAFYAYIILGLDYDTFEELGGDEQMNKAQQILNSVPRGTAKGWAVNDGDRTRYWLIENLLNVRVQPLRRALYSYHLLGLDQLSKDESMAGALQAMTASIEAFQKVNQDYPGSMIIQLLINAKRSEIVEVFKVADGRTRRRIYDLMIKLDGTHTGDYKALLE